MDNQMDTYKFPKLFVFLSLFVGAIILTACGIVGRDDHSEYIATSAAQTLQAINQQQTLSVYQTLGMQLTQTAQVPNMTPTPTVTSVPPTSTPNPTSTQTQLACNWAAFIKDVTIADGSKVEEGAAFIKTWRLKNIGSCTWTKSYNLVLVDGTSFGAPTRIGLSASVAPGETVDISVLMKAPEKTGTYFGYWKLADAKGKIFGIGMDASGSFWVRIKIQPKVEVVYNFVSHYCDAAWQSSNTNPLSCPGDETADNAIGYIIKVAKPTREDGNLENEAGLITSPDNDPEDGKISGVYPAFKVEDGDIFKAVIGCVHNATDCDLYFDLRYRIGNSIRTLATWHEVYEGKMNAVSVDLSKLAGQKVEFILKVRNNDTAAYNVGLWILPRILRQQ
jgi:hypothetical protein